MLKITGDGRKLGLDQRIINQLLPDEPGTKVNQCVGNIMQIWRDGEADKLTQLVFCDISTPRQPPPKRQPNSWIIPHFMRWNRLCRWMSLSLPLPSMRTSARSSSPRECPPSRLLLSTKPRPRCRRKNCFPRFALGRCASCWAAPPNGRWHQCAGPACGAP